MDIDPASAVSPPRVAGSGETVVHGEHTELSRRDSEMLAFERQWWRHAGAKETAIRERFGLSPTRYYQALNALVDQPAALAADPVLVRRLRRMRVARHRARQPRSWARAV